MPYRTDKGGSRHRSDRGRPRNIHDRGSLMPPAPHQKAGARPAEGMRRPRTLVRSSTCPGCRGGEWEGGRPTVASTVVAAIVVVAVTGPAVAGTVVVAGAVVVF